jgi:hypothetical protein
MIWSEKRRVTKKDISFDLEISTTALGSGVWPANSKSLHCAKESTV